MNNVEREGFARGRFGNGNKTVQGGRRWPSGKRIKSSKEEKTILLFPDVAHKSRGVTSRIRRKFL